LYVFVNGEGGNQIPPTPHLQHATIVDKIATGPTIALAGFTASLLYDCGIYGIVFCNKGLNEVIVAHIRKYFLDTVAVR
jgi:hypothetical protein